MQVIVDRDFSWFIFTGFFFCSSSFYGGYTRWDLAEESQGKPLLFLVMRMISTDHGGYKIAERGVRGAKDG